MVRESENEQISAEITPAELLEHLQQRLPGFTPTAPPDRIRAGYPNWVYRVRGEPEPLIVKVTIPKVPLHQHRLDIEARCLAAFEPSGPLESVGSTATRPPHHVDYDPSRRILAMEDVGDVPHMGDWLLEGRGQRESQGPQRPGQLLGHFVAVLHWESFADPQLAMDFDNSAIQSSRLKLHYGAVGDMCREAGVPDAAELGESAVATGEQLQTPGVCIIQGDLQPASVLLTASGLRVIDWGLAHYGHPAQDVGHMLAHLWMYAHRALTPNAEKRPRTALRDFLSTYRAGLGSAFNEVFGASGVRQSTVHFGTEILMRTVGALQEGYLYQGLTTEAPAVQEAVDMAARHIRSPENVDTFAPLRP